MSEVQRAVALDPAFDFRSDSRGDPDDRVAGSPSLRQAHRWLWSKPLPAGGAFELDTSTAYTYLHDAKLDLGLASDTIVHCYEYGYRDAAKAFSDARGDAVRDGFVTSTYTLGGFIVFPVNAYGDRRWTINQARGVSSVIKDRFDLTLECIRRHYEGEPSPLADVLMRYASFFELFGTFCGYVDFFHLQDLVVPGVDQVAFLLPFDDFARSPLPRTQAEYDSYRERAMEFLALRGERMAAWRPSTRP